MHAVFNKHHKVSPHLSDYLINLTIEVIKCPPNSTPVKETVMPNLTPPQKKKPTQNLMLTPPPQKKKKNSQSGLQMSLLTVLYCLQQWLGQVLCDKAS